MDASVILTKWPGSNSGGWSYQRKNCYATQIVFELPRLANFTEPRFVELGEKLEDRKLEVARRQLQMLRQMHGVGADCALTLRLRRDGNRLRQFVIVRISKDQSITTKVEQELASHIATMFPREYNFVQIEQKRDPLRWKQATDLTWVQFIDEVIKPEADYPANTWPYFYVASLWQPQSNNDMEIISRTLLQFSGEAMLDFTLIPTTFTDNERNWLEGCVRVMRDAHTGERLYSREDNRLLKTFPPLPALRSSLDNYEDLLKRYNQNRVFLYSFRVFASSDPFSITQALIASATRSQPQIIRIKRGQSSFREALQAGQAVDIAPEIQSLWWKKYNEVPYRAQRLHRLADLDEVSSFWRLPISVQAGFPGFELDLRTKATDEILKGVSRSYQISLGYFSDDTSQSHLPAVFDRQGLAKHGLIVGVPGSGKTTTMFNLLTQLWDIPNDQDRIPFIVLEPAKTEYRALKTLKTFSDDLLIFTVGDERISPFRLNPFEVPKGIAVESHISRLNACFTGAFSLFDPLPLLLDRAIREIYQAHGWYDESVGGEPGLTTPTLADLCRHAIRVVQSSGYSDKLRDDFNAALIQRLESLRRGSKGRMLDTRDSIPLDLLMHRPVILELDALNEDEKSLLMMFILNLVYEYSKANRRSGSPLRHVLLVEEAHNLIGRGDNVANDIRANPKEQSIRLFVRMLAEMRALGQGILIADQLPTALASEAVKQTNLKIMMRLTAMDDRQEMGNTMDLGEAELKEVTRFKSGQALVYLEDWDRVRQVQTPNFKDAHTLSEPPDNTDISDRMKFFELNNAVTFMPFPECPIGCQRCNRRVRSQAERLVQSLVKLDQRHINNEVRGDGPWSTLCRVARLKALAEAVRLSDIGHNVDAVFPFCAYVHLLHEIPDSFTSCAAEISLCDCKVVGRENTIQWMIDTGKQIVTHQ